MLLVSILEIEVICPSGGVQDGFGPVCFLEPVQENIQLPPDIGLMGWVFRLLPIKLHIHSRREAVFLFWDRSDESIRLCVASAVEAEEVIGTHTQSGPPRPLPVVRKHPICKTAAFSGLDIGELHILSGKHTPVDLALVGGDIDTPDRIAASGGIVEPQDPFGKKYSNKNKAEA